MEQEKKLVYAVRVTRGHRFCGVSTTPRGMGLLLLGYFLFKSHENGSGVVRSEMAMDFGSKEGEPRLMRELSMDRPRTDLGLLKTV